MPFTLLHEYGPMVAISVGTVAAAVLGLSTWLSKNTWKSQDARTERTARYVAFLREDLKRVVANNATEHKMMHDLIHGLRAEHRLASKDFAMAKSGLIALEKTVRAQQQTMYEHVKYVSRLEIRIEDLSKQPSAFSRMNLPDT